MIKIVFVLFSLEIRLWCKQKYMSCKVVYVRPQLGGGGCVGNNQKVGNMVVNMTNFKTEQGVAIYDVMV